MLRSYRSLALAPRGKVSNPTVRLHEHSTGSLPRQGVGREIFWSWAVGSRMGREGVWRTAGGHGLGRALQ